MQARYTDLRKIHAHADAVRFVAREFKVTPIAVCDALGLDASFLIARSWE